MCAEARRAPFAFVLTTGDNFSAPDGVATKANFWRPERCLRAMRIPWRAAWGNHDLAGDATATVLGAPRRHYAFDAGPARILVLDANDPDDPGQLAFMRRELARPSPGPLIAAFHQPLRTAGIHRPDPLQRRLWVPLLRRGGVDLVLQGHNHAYERIEADGMVHITTGGGGAQLFPCVRPEAGLRACRFAHHFLAVTVAPRAIGVRAIGPRGDTIDRIRIPVG